MLSRGILVMVEQVLNFGFTRRSRLNCCHGNVANANGWKQLGINCYLN